MGAPAQNNVGFLVGTNPVFSVTGTVNINSGSAIAAGATITENYTFTGALTTDINFGIAHRPGVTALPAGLQLSALSVSATNTVTASWTNTTTQPITPPASATWTYIVQNEFFR